MHHGEPCAINAFPRMLAVMLLILPQHCVCESLTSLTSREQCKNNTLFRVRACVCAVPQQPSVLPHNEYRLSLALVCLCFVFRLSVAFCLFSIFRSLSLSLSLSL
eukprot:Opistho-2@70432